MNKTQIKQLKMSIGSLSRWNSSGKVFGHVGKIEGLKNTSKKSDRLYEFYCLLSLLSDFRENYTIRLKHKINGKIVFPLAPGDKNSFSYFEITDKYDSNSTYQVCYGTNVRISDAPGSGFAPDISIQKGTSDFDPDETMVLMIYDAKYKSKKDALDISTIREFSQCVADMQTQRASKKRLKFNKLVDLKGNCLITNGRVITKHEQYCIKKAVRQIGNFDLWSSHVMCG
jgi:hypothetical protein